MICADLLDLFVVAITSGVIGAMVGGVTVGLFLD